MNQKVKCPKCGYIHDTDYNNEISTCPLCDNEYETQEGIKLNETSTQPVEQKEKPRSLKKIIAEWSIFGISLAIFIVLLTYIFEFILSK